MIPVLHDDPLGMNAIYRVVAFILGFLLFGSGKCYAQADTLEAHYQQKVNAYFDQKEGQPPRYVQTARVSLPAKGRILGAFLDTLAQELKERPGIMCRRSPNGEGVQASALVGAKGEGRLADANQAVIHYRFVWPPESRDLEEQIHSIQFVRRRRAISAPNQDGKPILYLDFSTRWGGKMLTKEHPPDLATYAADKHFSDWLRFSRVLSTQEEAKIIAIGEQKAGRNRVEEKKKAFVELIRRLSYAR